MPDLSTLRVSLLPIDIVLSDWQSNIESVLRCFASSTFDSDVVVLPELFSTGFIRSYEKASDIARAAWPQALSTLRRLAAEYNCAIAGSMMYLEEDSGQIYNRAFFADPDGGFWHYDKRHLFALGAEPEVFTRGNEPSPIINFRGWKIALAVCYDIRFPAWLRNIGLKYDVLLVPANWPEARAFAWRHLLQARAIENQAYVVGANRSGEDKMGLYTGQSFICDYTGNVIGNSNSDIKIDAELSKTSLDTFRDKFPFWRDADNVLILE